MQLAKLVNKFPDGEDWLYELKYDGYMILAFLEGNNVKLITRNGNDRKGAAVSMPITWKELDTVALDGINMADALMRIGGNDPWKDFFQNNQQLK